MCSQKLLVSKDFEFQKCKSGLLCDNKAWGNGNEQKRDRIHQHFSDIGLLNFHGFYLVGADFLKYSVILVRFREMRFPSFVRGAPGGEKKPDGDFFFKWTRPNPKNLVHKKIVGQAMLMISSERGAR